MKKITRDQFKDLLIADTPLLDVRAPVEFVEGHLPQSENIPILNNTERELIGTTYKKQGREIAVELGHQTVSGINREIKIKAWKKYISENPNAVIYCFRGGLRSQTAQAWLQQEGVSVPLIDGGFKAVRNFLIEATTARMQELKFEVVSGPTGSGKTDYLYQSKKLFIDLEKLACHRGSAFGSMEVPQPTQINFEIALAVALLKTPNTGETVLIENESRLVGKCCLPDVVFEQIKTSPKLILQVSVEQRVENILKDYIINSKLVRENDLTRFDDFRKAIISITKKLGGLRAQEILTDIDFSQNEYIKNKDISANRIWIKKLLEWYYDPLYQKSSERQWPPIGSKLTS